MNFKIIMVWIGLVALSSCSPKNGMMVKKDKDGSKMLVGKSDKDALMNDKAFAWFKSGYDQYIPDSTIVKELAAKTHSVRIEVFGFWQKLHMEERFMLEQFPDEYPAYREQVKMLVPFLL